MPPPPVTAASTAPGSKAAYNRLLLVVAGLGGLLYGIDVGIIAGAFPYLEATSGLNPSQLSFVVAAVLAGSVVSRRSVAGVAGRLDGTQAPDGGLSGASFRR